MKDELKKLGIALNKINNWISTPECKIERIAINPTWVFSGDRKYFSYYLHINCRKDIPSDCLDFQDIDELIKKIDELIAENTQEIKNE